jgi:hypothetical protein
MALVRFVRRNKLMLIFAAIPFAIVLVVLASPLFEKQTQKVQLTVVAVADPYAIKATNANLAVNSTGIFGVTNAPGSKAIYGYTSATTGAPSIGVAGISQNGYGLYGSSYAPGVAGIFGENIGAGGTSVQGNSATGDGVVGLAGLDGVVGVTTHVGSGQFSGVAGVDESTEGNFGVSGQSDHGVAVYGVALGSGAGGVFSSGDGDALFGDAAGSGDGVRASSDSGYGIEVASSTGTAIEASSGSVGIAVRAPATGYPLALTNGGGDRTLFLVNGTGDVYYSGTLHSAVAKRDGGAATTFASNATRPTIEDFGSGRLENGSASVTLDKAFAQTLDPSATYRVFLTPNGDTRGLFVTAKTAGGFVVRENRGGRDSVDFDYRIVGVANGSGHKRMEAIANLSDFAHVPGHVRPARTAATTRGLAPNLGPYIRASSMAR